MHMSVIQHVPKTLHHTFTKRAFHGFLAVACVAMTIAIGINPPARAQTGNTLNHFEFIPVPGALSGCYPFTYTGYSVEPDSIQTSSWWIETQDLYNDGDMSLHEAWEFTTGDPKVKIGSFGGVAAFNADYMAGPEYREVKSSLGEGQDWFSLLNHRPLNTAEDVDGSIPHSLHVLQVIAADHDTTAGGTIGIAPDCTVLPYAYYADESTFTSCIEDAIAKGVTAMTFSISVSGATVQRGIDSLVRHGILPIASYGNTNTGYNRMTKYPDVLFVAGNAGLYKTPVSLYGEKYPKPALTAAAPFGGFTSFSAAAVAGTVALMKSLNPALTMSELRTKLLCSVTPLADPLWNPDSALSKLGTGRLDAYVAISLIKKGVIDHDEKWSGPIYIPEDVIIPHGVTVTIDLTPCPNGLARTHVRFGCETNTQPRNLILPKIVVQGTLIVRGSESEKVLFSPLLNRFQVSEWKWTSMWGGITVEAGGRLDMEHAIIEKALGGIQAFSPDVTLRDTKLCDSPASATAPPSAHREGAPDERVTLFQNHPNPFNPVTTVAYAVYEAGVVNIRITDALGRTVSSIHDGWQDAGYHTAVFDAASLPSGVYFIAAYTKGAIVTRSMIRRN